MAGTSLSRREASRTTNGAVRVGSLAELKGQGCRVVTGQHGPIAVFYHNDRVYAVDNRCPHMGFPLHRGTVQDGILTCHWHHARFDLASGCTFNLFADDVPTYPVEVRDGDVWLTPHRERQNAKEHWLKRLDEGMEQNISLVMAKAIIALQSEGVDYREIVRRGVLYGTRNRAAGWASGLTILTAMANLVPHLAPEEQYLALYQGLLHSARDCAGQPPRRDLQPLGNGDLDPATLTRWFRGSVEVRDSEGAERCLLTALERGLPIETVADMLFLAATDHFYLDGGHTVDFINKAFEALELIGWDAAPQVLPSVVGQLCRAGRAEESQSWRQPIDLVPLLRAASEDLPAMLAAGAGKRWEPSARFTETLLGDDPQGIVAALNEALRGGATPVQLAQEVAYAASLRICRFGTQNEFGDWIAVLHTFTYANAFQQALGRAGNPALLRGIYHGAMRVYLDRFLNIPPARLPDVRKSNGSVDPDTLRAELLAQMDTRQQVDESALLVARYLADGHPAGALLQSLGTALLREDAEFHTFQMLEAGARQYGALGDTPRAQHVLIAVTRYLAAHSPTDRARQQTARIALRLHRGDALYEDEAASA
jgi:nitrite reductase/ring-hydroxylating ferredoxin subunit